MKCLDLLRSSWWGKDPVPAASACIAKAVLALAWFGTLAPRLAAGSSGITSR